LVSWEHAACPLSGIEKRPLVGGWLNTSSVVISISATASVRYREVVRSWEGPLWEAPLYRSPLQTITEQLVLMEEGDTFDQLCQSGCKDNYPIARY